MSKGDAISKSMSALIQQLLNDILQAKAILTPAQKQIIREYMASRAHGSTKP